MLCKINATVGGATDEKARAINFLRAIEAICTAPAGSTPSVPSITAPNASPAIGTAGSVDVITEVISNTEAGGWTSSSSTNVVSNYNTSFTEPYRVDLYRDSGKALYPYRKLTFRTNIGYYFNAAYATYPYIHASHGFNTVTTASGLYMTAVNNVDIPETNGTGTMRYKHDVNYADTSTEAANLFQPRVGEWLVASTDRYFICMSGGTSAISAGSPGYLMYVGLRTTGAWEDQYDDNPPLASVCFDGSIHYQNGGGSHASMFARTFQFTGAYNSNPAWYRIYNANSGVSASTGDFGGNNIDPLSGVNYTAFPSSTTQLMNQQFLWGNQMQIPMCGGVGGLFRTKHRQNTTMTGPVTDTATGLLVPPAYPITFARHHQTSMNPGGQAIGLYKSLGGTETFLQRYYTPGQTFVVNNEAYYSYAIGNDASHRDLFLIRKY
jgi:hypothetical protein